MNFLLWPFKKIYQLEQKIIDLLCIPFKFLSRNSRKDDGPIVLVDFESTKEVKEVVRELLEKKLKIKLKKDLNIL